METMVRIVVNRRLRKLFRARPNTVSFSRPLRLLPSRGIDFGKPNRPAEYFREGGIVTDKHQRRVDRIALLEQELEKRLTMS